MDINTDLSSLSASGKKVNSKGEEFLAEAKKLESYLEELKNSWQGTDNQSYNAAVTERMPDIKNLGMVIKDYGNFMSASSKYLSDVQNEIKSRSTKL